MVLSRFLKKIIEIVLSRFLQKIIEMVPYTTKLEKKCLEYH